jgi:hypothetical protein
MNDTTADTQEWPKYFLYTFPDGHQRVYEMRGKGRGGSATLFVRDQPACSFDARYDLDDGPPEDVFTTGTEISEEEMKQATGYYTDGATALENATCGFLCEMERVPKGDRYYEVAQALRIVIDGFSLDNFNWSHDKHAKEAC